MITVSEIAKELNVSVQTIYRMLNSVKQDVKQSESVCLTEKINGVIHFTDVGERFIRERLTGVKQNNEDCLTVLNDVKQPLNTVKQSENDEILFLREQNKTLLQELEREREHNREALEREREHSRQQADRISDLAEKLAELTRNSQVLLKQEQDKNVPLLTLPDESPKKGIFRRLFVKK